MAIWTYLKNQNTFFRCLTEASQKHKFFSDVSRLFSDVKHLSFAKFGLHVFSAALLPNLTFLPEVQRNILFANKLGGGRTAIILVLKTVVVFTSTKQINVINVILIYGQKQ